MHREDMVGPFCLTEIWTPARKKTCAQDTSPSAHPGITEQTVYWRRGPFAQDEDAIYARPDSENQNERG